MRLRARRVLCGIVALLIPGAFPAAASLAIVIDDVGYSRSAGQRALALPGRLTIAVLPGAPESRELATAAYAAGHQVLVHLPMQSIHGHRLGPRGLGSWLGREEFTLRVKAAFAAVPHASGANNHMGSLLTTRAPQMDWLMALLAQRRGWLFLDSRTTHLTVAAVRARAAGVPTLSRDVFLDNDPHVAAVREQLREAVNLARTRGRAVAIGHPHSSTLSVLERALPGLARDGVRLVTLTDLLQARGGLLRTGYGSGGQAAMTR